MSTHYRHPDLNAHEPGCTKMESVEPVVDPDSGYADIFCDCHHYTEPKILMNGTDIAWPAGWTPEQSSAWRSEHGLAPPTEAATGA